MQAAYQAGMSMPGRLSVVGYDDIDLAPYTIPPLTTVTQTGVAMGHAATTLLLDMLDQNLAREEVPDIILPTSLVVRASTSRPPP